MAIIKTLKGVSPKFGKNCFLADNAAIIGDVTMGDECSIWYSATLRGDVNTITLGNRVNIQDGAVVHTLYKRSVAVIGNNVSVGHNAIIHGAHVHDNCLIGMGAILLDNVVVGSGSIVAAGSTVLSGTVIPENEVWGGMPARKLKDITAEQSRDIVTRTANDYVMYASWYTE